MIIQVNSDNNIAKNEEQIAQIKLSIADGLSLYSKDITRIETHLSDENGSKIGQQDKRCMLEARIANRQSLAVTSYANTTELAISDALDKLNAALQTVLSKLKSH
jgi:hypothetical protein